MNVSARAATPEDLTALLALYRGLEAEMIPLESVWARVDGLPEPVDAAFLDLMGQPGVSVLIGMIEGVPLGFLIGRQETMQPQAEGARIGSVRFLFTEMEAREVGIAEAMLEAYLAIERGDGITLFDAHVTPGHRLTKNFFESKGFSARSIVMHHDDSED